MKKLVIALMAFALVITLAGCGGGGGSSEHWGDRGANLDDDISKNYQAMQEAFKPDTVNKMTTEAQRRAFLKENFTDFIKPGARFCNNAYTREDMNSRMASVLGSYKFKEYSFEPGETGKVSDSKYTSWVRCHIYADRNDGKKTQNLSDWMQLTWEKGEDGKWYITGGFDNSYWFKSPNA